MSDVEQNPNPDSDLYARFLRQFKTTVSDFGRQPAFPLPAVKKSDGEILPAAAYGIAGGLNIRQYVWLQLYCAEMASSNNTTSEAAAKVADHSLPNILAHLENLR